MLASKACVFPGNRRSAFCSSRGSSRRICLRLAFQEQPQLDCPPVDAIPLHRNCRDEIIPILRALQPIDEQTQVRQKLLERIGADVNPDSSPDRGREGMSYGTIRVLAAVRLGCNFDDDKLQDLAEQHRTLRLIRGIADGDEPTDFDGRRIRDNLCLLQPATIDKINHLVVAAGHELAPVAIEAVPGDTLVVETNVHYPTESTLIEDGLGKVLTRAARLAKAHALPGWRQHEHLLQERQGQGAAPQPYVAGQEQGCGPAQAGVSAFVERGGGRVAAGS
jgi:IS5 family transposase